MTNTLTLGTLQIGRWHCTHCNRNIMAATNNPAVSIIHTCGHRAEPFPIFLGGFTN